MNPGDSRVIAERAVGDRRLHEVFYPGGMRQDRHRHRWPALSFVVKGRYRENVGRQAHSRNDATIVFHPADEYHAVQFESDVLIVGVEFQGDSGQVECFKQSSNHRSVLVEWLGIRLWREMARSDASSTLAIDGILSEMLVEGSRARVLNGEKGFVGWLVRATDYVHDNFTTTFSLEDVAETAGVHSAHLSRVFRQRMHCTVGEYVRRLRLEFACQQIVSTERPLCDVAYEAGFADQSHFHRTFRRQLGVTPFAYRKIHRG